MIFRYDVLVIGGGHAGCEAARAAAKLGAKTCLITMDMNKIAQMSCNPAVGGIAKGQIVREVDALGGEMGIITDSTSIQFRMLNKGKGPSVWSPRAQCDRAKFITKFPIKSLLISLSLLLRTFCSIRLTSASISSLDTGRFCAERMIPLKILSLENCSLVPSFLTTTKVLSSTRS